MYSLFLLYKETHSDILNFITSSYIASKWLLFLGICNENILNKHGLHHKLPGKKKSNINKVGINSFLCYFVT